ncbi:hypothetical protein B0J14DRAFT_159592 [Halenospora varia]|nr:hypothetical protein B0J14DRAFT_159592 [Halenospora varia]
MSLPPLPTSASNRLSTPPMSTSHSGLPPPLAMTMPQLTQGPLPMSQPPLSQPIGQLRAPQQWQGAEEPMWSWLNARIEEYKQKQEEEKTRQELLRLEQRRIEQDMLWAALTGGIPPYMIPTVFAGVGGGNLPNASLELAQRSMAQGHHPPQQQLLQRQQLLSAQAQASLERQRSESLLPSQRYVPQQHPMPVPPPRAVQNSGSQSDYQTLPASPSGQSHQPQGSPARSPPTSHLPELNTGKMHIHLLLLGHSAMQILPG